MSKHTKTARGESKSVRKDWPLVIYVWIVGLGLFGYLTGRLVFDPLPHPVHRASGLVGAVAGYFVGWLWYRWRGDIR